MYDSVYTEIYVSSNGYVLFDDTYSTLTNYELPTSNTTSSMIAMWWDDLDPPEAGNVYYYYDANVVALHPFVGKVFATTSIRAVPDH